MKKLFHIDRENAAEAEQALQVLEQNLIRTLDACAYGIILFDAHGNCLTLNKKWTQLYQLDYENMREYNMLHDPVIKTKHIWQAVRKSFEGEYGVLADNYFTPEEWNKPGRGRWTRGHALPIFSSESEDRQIGQALVLEDVTEVKMLQSELEKLSAQIREAHSMQDKIYRSLSDFRELEIARATPGILPESGLKKISTEIPAIPRREREVFEKLASGCSVKEAAHQLNIGIKSVYTYRMRLLKRLNLSSDVELAIAWRNLQDIALLTKL